ncbi:MAG TPA: hypothetical protein PKY30_23035, partial [Myxococcota bacterium]|nr:hypothetical protein [Myxococcota bacterium]
VVVHEAVDREEPHGVAVKRADYTNDRGGPWWFQMVFEDGTFDTSQPYQPCMDCHAADWRPTEGLWGVPTFAK